MSVYLSDFIRLYICSECGKPFDSDLEDCCSHCGSVAPSRKAVGRAICKRSSPPACPRVKILKFFPKGEEPENFAAIVKKYQRAQWQEVALYWAGVACALVAGFACGWACALT